MYASITTTDPELYVSARLIDRKAGEVQFTLGSRATLVMSLAEAEQIVSH